MATMHLFGLAHREHRAIVVIVTRPFGVVRIETEAARAQPTNGLTNDAQAGRRGRGETGNAQHGPPRQADDVQLAVGVEAERADVAELTLAAELRGVLRQPRCARLPLAVDRERDRPDAALDKSAKK